MEWLNRQVSFYSSHGDNTGRPVVIGQILRTEFVGDLDTIIDLRALNPSDHEYKKKKVELKSSLSCFTPAGLLSSKKKGEVSIIERSGLIQLDFDHVADIEYIKKQVFQLPFVAFCGLSCSGTGFYALVQIAEPQRITEYVEKCFEIFPKYGFVIDTSKGRNVQDLRYVSYDKNMLIREDPTPLRVWRSMPKLIPEYKPKKNTASGEWVDKMLDEVLTTTTGNRFQTVQKVAYTLGGMNNDKLLDEILARIDRNIEFNGQESKYCKIAKDCFEDGKKKPL